MINFRRPTNEIFLYGLAFSLALFLRLLLLGAAPLGDAEAGWALQALGLARGTGTVLGPQPAYLVLTGLLFDFLGSSGFLARLIPALAGSLLVLAPFLLRESIGRKSALVLAFALAFDAGLLALSRQASGVIVAVSMGMLALSAWRSARPRLAGVFAALALLGGPSIWPGLAGFGLAALLGRWLFGEAVPLGTVARVAARAGVLVVETGNGHTQQPALLPVADRVGPPAPASFEPVDLSEPENGETHETGAGALTAARQPRPLMSLFAFAGLALLVIGTAFFRHPRALSAAAASLPAYLQTWGQPGALPSGWWMYIFTFYHPVPLIFGLWSAGRAWVQGLKTERWLSLWFAVSLLIAVLNPAHRPVDLVWPLLPLWLLAAREIGRHLGGWDLDRFPVLGQAALTLFIMVFTWMNLGGWLTALQNNLPDAKLYAVVFIGALGLLAASTYLIAWGWTIRTAARGLVWGSLVALTLYTISAGTHAAGLRGQTAELWSPGPVVGQVELIASTAAELSEQRFTNRTAIDLAVAGVDSPALQWVLRDFTAARFVNAVEFETMPSVVVSTEADQPALAAAYRGQDFVLSRVPEWSSYTSVDWLRWLVYRITPSQPQNAVLWARTDLFPAGEISASTAPTE